ncbi:rhomboid family intramembrane serine protease [Nodosilinea sp. E11]|uniref:rhomboid family intramembrane serine protease n=1 Tax=Nodosilinea sp. E11 TaxID=3037479 RepID=UPI0029342EA5|nr:rhomboid family intramembrane serine protease [Nodosilinea sp. E11]WOD39328.1 rhomboid family intramembrane serine protease [Nodosilinea sp. E11]
MVPLRDDNPVSITPGVTYGLIGLNIAVFVFQLSLSREGLDRFFDTWALVPAQLTESFQGAMQAPAYEWFTLISSQFLHGGFFHIGGNLLYLWVFGNNIEDRLGHLRFLIFYLGCGVLAGLTQWVFDPSSTVPTIGASGAIAGVMGAYILRFPRARIVTLIPLIIFFTTVRIPAIFFLGFWFVQQALFSLASLSSDVNLGSSGVAYWAHSGGFVFGLILGPLLGLMAPKPRSPRR